MLRDISIFKQIWKENIEELECLTITFQVEGGSIFNPALWNRLPAVEDQSFGVTENEVWIDWDFLKLAAIVDWILFKGSRMVTFVAQK